LTWSGALEKSESSAFTELDVHDCRRTPFPANQYDREKLGGLDFIFRAPAAAEKSSSVSPLGIGAALPNDEIVLEPGIRFLVDTANHIGDHHID